MGSPTPTSKWDLKRQEIGQKETYRSLHKEEILQTEDKTTGKRSWAPQNKKRRELGSQSVLQQCRCCTLPTTWDAKPGLPVHRPLARDPGLATPDWLQKPSPEVADCSTKVLGDGIANPYAIIYIYLYVCVYVCTCTCAWCQSRWSEMKDLP